jgi:hypothetical protein
VWRIRTNQELGELYKTPDLAPDIKRRRFDWLGFMFRMDETRVSEKICKETARQMKSGKAQNELTGRCGE